MNSENEVAVLQQILPAHDQRHEPFLHTSESDSSLGVSKTADTDQAFSSPSAKRKQRPRPKPKQLSTNHPPLSPFQQASTSQSASELGQLPNGGVQPTDAAAASPAWYSASQAAPEGGATDAEEPPSSALAAIQNVATQLGSSLALWGTYISDFVADVAGDNEPTEEEAAAIEKQKQAAKEASLKSQGSVTGDLAQPLTRRHSRSSSGRLSRGASLRLDGDWLVSPNKGPVSPCIDEADANAKTESDEGETEIAKKDS